MGKTIIYFALVFACTCLLVGCGGSSTKKGTVEGPKPGLKGEPETQELLKAMESIANTQDLEKRVELLDRLQAAGNALVALKLTEAENRVLEEKYGAKKAELHNKIEDQF